MHTAPAALHTWWHESKVFIITKELSTDNKLPQFLAHHIKFATGQLQIS